MIYMFLVVYTGGILKWEQQCRIVHMCTRRYLAVKKTGDVTLTTDSNDPSTVFRLHAVIRVRLTVGDEGNGGITWCLHW